MMVKFGEDSRRWGCTTMVGFPASATRSDWACHPVDVTTFPDDNEPAVQASDQN